MGGSVGGVIWIVWVKEVHVMGLGNESECMYVRVVELEVEYVPVYVCVCCVFQL